MIIISGMLVLVAVLLLARVGKQAARADRGRMSEQWIAEYRSSHLANRPGIG